MQTNRRIKKIVKGNAAVDGAGVSLTRVLSRPDVYDFDPFLMLDSFDSTNPNEYIKGFPWHPHRGIETLTYLKYGKIEHQDSLGNEGSIENDEAQWMSASSGILHQEMPKATKRLLGFQLWINIPAQDKMDAPKYNDLQLGNGINTYHKEGVKVDVLAGKYQGILGFQPDYVKATVLIIELKPETIFEFDVPEENTLFLYTMENKIKLYNQVIEEKSAVLLSDGNHLSFASLDNNCLIALFSAKPLKEEIAWGGPIVMNTKEELNQAFVDLENNTFIKE